MGFRFKNHLIRGILSILGLFFLLMNSSEGVAMGTQNARPVIVLDCPQEAPQPRILCQAMFQALSEASPASDIRSLDAGETFQARSGDLEVALRLDGVPKNEISGHLEWRSGPSDDMHIGPRVDLDVMDATYSSELYTNFANRLIGATPKMLSD